jgi:hypothetical protein
VRSCPLSNNSGEGTEPDKFSSTDLLPSGGAATPGESLILLQKSWLMIPSKAYAFLHGKEVCKV